MFNFFIENKLILSKPGNSCINQLLSITHGTYKSFDLGLEVRSVFFDISKALDKVWHDSIIYKLTQNGISGNLLNLLEKSSKDKSLYGKISMLDYLKVLGPLLLLIYINDLAEGLTTNTKLFADDPSLFSDVHDTRTSVNDLNKDLE